MTVDINSLFTQSVKTATITVVPSIFSNSSMVEQGTVNAKAVGSSPTLRATASRMPKLTVKPLLVNESVTLLYKSSINNCVSYSKQQTGIDRPLGNGARKSIQGHAPKIGAIGSLKGAVHAVVVTAINGNMITFTESNLVKNYITQRTLPLSQFIGFVYN